MSALLAVARLIDRLNTTIGRAAGWLILGAVVVSAGNALSRKFLSIGSNAWLELQWYLYAGVFMLGAGYTLLKDAHVRIDIVSAQLRKRSRDWIDVFGHVFFLMPLCLILLYDGIPFFLRSFSSGEHSSNAGGLLLWPVKLLVPLGFGLLLLQAVSELIKRIAILRGQLDDKADGDPDPDETGPDAAKADGGAAS